MRITATVGSLRRDKETLDRAPTARSGISPEEVLNRLTPIAVCAEELRRLALPRDARDLVELVLHATTRTVRTARSLARCAERPRVSRTSCNVNDLLAAVAREFDPVCRALGIALLATPVAACPTVMLDLGDLRDGLGLVLDVAADACTLPRVGSGAVLKVGIEPSPDRLAILVRCNGEALPGHVLEHAFAPGRPQPPGGTSLALYLARAAATRQGGELDVRREAGWTVFEIVLPSVAGSRRERLARKGAVDLRVIHGDVTPGRSVHERTTVVPPDVRLKIVPQPLAVAA